MNRFTFPGARIALLALVAFLVAGCETLGIGPIGKRIDYKSASSGPALELPPDLTTPQYDDRFSVTTASGLAAQNAGRPKQPELLPTNPEARIARAGNERWLVVKATPEQAWSTVRKFWTDTGFVLATEQPGVGVMETDWAENRAEIPQDLLRKYVGKYLDVFYTTYKRDKFRTRIERGSEPGTVEIYVSHRGMEQVPTTKIDNVQGAGFAWAVMPANPSLEAEMLSRMMMRFGAPEAVAEAAASPAAAAAAPQHARLRSIAHGAASGSRSIAAASPSSTAIGRAARTSCASPIPTRTWRGRIEKRASCRSCSRSGRRTTTRTSRSNIGSRSSRRRRRAPSACRTRRATPTGRRRAIASWRCCATN
jgi:uncharacterized lipoprotein